MYRPNLILKLSWRKITPILLLEKNCFSEKLVNLSIVTVILEPGFELRFLFCFVFNLMLFYFSAVGALIRLAH